MVQDIQCGSMEFKRGALAEFEPLEYGEVRHVGNCIGHAVARNVAKRRVEDYVCLTAVRDKADVVRRYRNYVVRCWIRVVNGIEADQLACGCRAADTERVACISSVNAYLGYRSIHVA